MKQEQKNEIHRVRALEHLKQYNEPLLEVFHTQIQFGTAHIFICIHDSFYNISIEISYILCWRKFETFQGLIRDFTDLSRTQPKI